MACKRCQKAVSDSATDVIFCRGYCGQSFHVFCANVDLPLLNTLKENCRNVFWMCDECADLFSNDHFRHVSSRCAVQSATEGDAIKPLKDDIAKLTDAINTLSAKVNTKPPTTPLLGDRPSFNRLFANTPKRARYDLEPPATSSTRGTKAMCDLVKTVPTGDDRVWIYLSAFHPSTTEDEIIKLVQKCLNLETQHECKVTKLIPKGKNLADLNFVSFKVGINQTFRDASLSCDTWPENVLFREFEDYRRSDRRIVRISNQTDQGINDAQH